MYHLVVLARAVLRTGFVLPTINGKGHTQRDKCMSQKLFVRHIRSALTHIGVPPEEAQKLPGHCLRAGGATSAVLGGLSAEEIAHLAGVNDSGHRELWGSSKVWCVGGCIAL